MKSKIYMYLFFFSILMVLFLFMNHKKMTESSEEKIEHLTAKLTQARDSLNVMRDGYAEANYFSLLGNENAISYIESLGMEADTVAK